jgi:diguanylate cyclase (GGDEF)-like protein
MTIYEKVLKEYPNPIFIVIPIFKNGACYDFKYVFVNQAFKEMVEKRDVDFIGKTYLEIFRTGEEKWFNFFGNVVKKKHLIYLNDLSESISKRLLIQGFFIEPNMCGCIVEEQSQANLGETTLINKAFSDYLTGFSNRFYLNEVQNLILGKKTIGLAFVDINSLKEINDKFGHDAGDKYIQQVANLIKELIPDSLYIRLGGDEFLILTSSINEEKYNKMLLNAQKEINKYAAVGFKYFGKILNLSKAIKEVDELMYKNKNDIKSRPDYSYHL